MFKYPKLRTHGVVGNRRDGRTYLTDLYLCDLRCKALIQTSSHLSTETVDTCRQKQTKVLPIFSADDGLVCTIVRPSVALYEAHCKADEFGSFVALRLRVIDLRMRDSS